MRIDSISNWLVWLGVLAGALSSIKALNVFLDFGFKGIWADVLNYYTKLTEPAREIFLRIPIFADLPIWLPDVLLLYVVLVLAGVRSTVLPYRFEDYYKAHNTRRTYDAQFSRQGEETFEEFLGRQTDFDRERMIMATHHKDNFKVKLQETIPKWELVARQSLKCLTLLPVITLEPLRKMDRSVSFVRRMLKKTFAR